MFTMCYCASYVINVNSYHLYRTCWLVIVAYRTMVTFKNPIFNSADVGFGACRYRFDFLQREPVEYPVCFEATTLSQSKQIAMMLEIMTSFVKPFAFELQFDFLGIKWEIFQVWNISHRTAISPLPRNGWLLEAKLATFNANRLLLRNHRKGQISKRLDFTRPNC